MTNDIFQEFFNTYSYFFIELSNLHWVNFHQFARHWFNILHRISVALSSSYQMTSRYFILFLPVTLDVDPFYFYLQSLSRIFWNTENFLYSNLTKKFLSVFCSLFYYGLTHKLKNHSFCFLFISLLCSIVNLHLQFGFG